MMAILMAFVVIGLSYTAVALGLPIIYGIWLIILAPIVMIWFFGRDNEHWLAKDSG
ncbi:hypothetical protein [Psychrobacter sp. A3]|uniref:hypothetical protein n=1 Tax=Psychrobacter sp. A3 TaxID=2992754 RepID=UPI00237A8F9C|nr:hypothetical protein [Psychrobacter sp. A3]